MTTTPYPDKLTAVKGIGKVYERRLNEAGYFTWAQIADLSAKVLQEITAASDVANVGTWPGQAKELAQRNQRDDAEYKGPIPDEFTEIAGIGESIQQRLYRNGIHTFHQLAELTSERLGEIIPIAKRSIDANLDLWIQQAQERCMNT